jgi:hypothetical protein
MAFLTVAAVSALCLLLPVTRVYGVAGIAALLYFRPALTLGAIAVGAITYIIYRRFFA